VSLQSEITNNPCPANPACSAFFDAMPVEFQVRCSGGTVVSNKKRASCKAGYHWKYQYGIYTEQGESVPWWERGTFKCGSRHSRQQSNASAMPNANGIEQERELMQGEF
jgi:hypothetical protein